MKLRPEEITSILKQRIEQYDVETDLSEVGTVLQVGDGIARVYGLENCVALERLEFEHGVVGIAFNLEEDNVGVALFGEWQHVKEGEPVRRTGAVMDVPVGEGSSAAWSTRSATRSTARGRSRRPSAPLEFKAPGVIQRQPVVEPLQTGLKAIDSMIPIGRGQRELIIGDRGTGKTAIGVDTIINQRGGDVICIYVAVGQKASTVAQVVERLRDAGAMDYTIVVSAPRRRRRRSSGWRRSPAPRWASTSSSTASTRSSSTTTSRSTRTRTGSSRCSSAARRAARRSPATSSTSTRGCSSARASSPDALGGGSLTALPIIETQAGDVAAYIPTNVISITDGQIFLESSLFYSGVRPAINVGISVSRVGGNAQTKAMKKVAGRSAPRPRPVPRARGVLAVRLGARRGDPAVARARRADGRDAQPAAVPAVAAEEQVVAIYAGINGALDRVPSARCRATRRSSARRSARRARSTRRSARSNDLSDETAAKLDEALAKFNESFNVQEERTGLVG